MMDMITVVIPSYNRGRTIVRAVESVLNQTYKNIEVIVVDDNSNDNTEEILSLIKDDRFIYIKNEVNKGACYSRNLGIKMAKGSYIAFQDSDDVWLYDKLEKQIKYLADNDYDIVSCAMKQIYPGKTARFPSIDFNIDNIKEDILYQNFFSTQTIVGKKVCFEEERFDNKMPRFQDWELMIRMCKKYKVGFLNEELVDVYIQNDSISRNNKKAVDALEIMNEKYTSKTEVKAFYYRTMGVYSMNSDINQSAIYFEKAYRYDKNKKNLVNYIITKMKLGFLLRYVYKKKGRV